MWVARLLFALRRRAGRRASAARFERERRRIQSLIRQCDAESGERRVLIQRVRGMEDSSRNWSFWMTLDHLRIVNGSIQRIIRALAGGVVPSGSASTAAVKPPPGAIMSVVPDYIRSCEDLAETVASIANLKTRLRYAHPWFGPLNAADWHAMAGGHMGIHRVQIERILEGLARAG